MENYREAFRQYIYRRISQYKTFRAAELDATPQKHNAYVNIRAVLALRFAPEMIFKQGGNGKMDYETYAKCCKAVDDMLPPKDDWLLREAKRLISDFCRREYASEADFDDLHRVWLAFTTTKDGKHQLQVGTDLVDFSIHYLVDGELVYRDTYANLSDMIDAVLSTLDFDGLISICTNHVSEK